MRQTIRSKFSNDNVIEAEHREVSPNWLQNEIEWGKKTETKKPDSTQPEKVEKLSSAKPADEPETKSANFDMFLTNSFGFGGTNSTLIIKNL